MYRTPRIYGISAAARELELSAEWLRKGEQRGSLPLAERDRNGYRYYTEEDLRRLRDRRLLGSGE
jgi:DNA-binding transcriptional MerR regulator